MASDNQTGGDTIRACAIAQKLDGHEQVIREMQALFGEQWGGLDLVDALPVLGSAHAEQIEFVALLVDNANDDVITLVRQIIEKVKSRNIRIAVLYAGVSGSAVTSLIQAGADYTISLPMPANALGMAYRSELEPRFMMPSEPPSEPAIPVTAEPKPQPGPAPAASPDAQTTNAQTPDAQAIVQAAMNPEQAGSQRQEEVQTQQQAPAPAPEPLALRKEVTEQTPAVPAEPAPQAQPDLSILRSQLGGEKQPAAETATAQPAPAQPVAPTAPVPTPPAQPQAPQATEQPAAVPPVAPAPAPAPAGETGRNGLVFPVYGLGGGVGASVFAVNLAWELQTLAEKKDKRVCIIDLSLQYGAVSTYLDVPRSELSLELLLGVHTIDGPALEQSMRMHNKRLAVFPAPTDAVPLDVVGPEEIGAMIDLAKSRYDYVVVDLPNVLTSWSETVLDRAKLFFALGELEMRTAQNALRFLRALKADDLPYEKVQFLLNRAPKRTDLNGRSRIKRMADSLNVEFRWLLPDGGRHILAACDQGQPLATLAARNPLRKEIRKVAESMFELSDEQAMKESA